jgi:MFS family permease
MQRGAKGDMFRSLRFRNFRLFFAGQLISQIGNWLTLVAQALLVFRVTNSGVALGILTAMQFGPVLLFASWAGLIADRTDKRRMLLRVQSIAMLQSFALAAVAFLQHPRVWMIYAVALVGGFGTAFDHPTRRSMVVELVPEDMIANAASLNTALMTSARVVGPALGGLLITTVGFGWTFTVDGVTYLAVLWALWRMDPAKIRRAAPATRGRGQVRAGLRYAWSVPDLRVPLIMMAVIGTLAYNFSTVLPLFVERDLARRDVQYTWLMSIVSVGSVLAALLSARLRAARLTRVSWSAIGFGASMALLAFAASLPMALAFGAVMGFASVSFMTASTTIVQHTADPSMRGRVMALQAIVFLGSTPIGGPLVGYLSQHLGARWGLGVGALSCLTAGAWGLTQRSPV